MKTKTYCKKYKAMTAAAAALVAMSAFSVQASSHREAPAITEMPKVDGTDFYMFRSYEPGREGFVTILANYLPLQGPGDGPNYYAFDEDAQYLIRIDNDGDAHSDITFRFEFTNDFQNIAVPTGPDADGNETMNTVPVITTVPGGIGPDVTQTEGLDRIESYTVRVSREVGSGGLATNLGNASGVGAGGTMFRKPVDNIGEKSINDYATYANNHIYGIEVPGCDAEGARVFVGQRKEGFVINIGEIFDLFNTRPLGPRDGETNALAELNVTSIAMEMPIECLTAGDDPVIGGWTVARLQETQLVGPRSGGSGKFVQVSRIASPLVNELVIGTDRKDEFNTSTPRQDLQKFASFVTNPTVPVLANALFGVRVPATPRLDLVQTFVTGIPGLTQPAAIAAGGGRGGEMLRLNTAFPEAPAAPSDQQDLGFLACDLSGFPNGRRVIDDVVDIDLNVLLGAITPDNPNGLQTCDVSGDAPTVVNSGTVITDGARPNPDDYLTVFPYLNTPLPGSPTN